jgi:hypothetical protein
VLLLWVPPTMGRAAKGGGLLFVGAASPLCWQGTVHLWGMACGKEVGVGDHVASGVCWWCVRRSGPGRRQHAEQLQQVVEC